jgi:hypothetical protein
VVGRLQSAGEEQLETAHLTVIRLRPVLLGTALLIAAGTLRAAEPAPSQDFNTQIARLDAQDPHSPRALEMHLRYANFLALSEAGECAPRLQAAQAEWDRVRANPALDVALPAGRAREADVGYLIHLARARCGAAAEREEELRAALAAAQTSAALYREEFDYVSMATMQFNAALALENLGREAEALASLEAVLATDREYGFRDDAAENTELWLRWQHLDSSPPQVEARMRDFPARHTALKFAWPAGVSDIKLDSDYARLIGEQVVRAHGERAVQRRVQKRAFHWVVTYQPQSSQYQLDELPLQPGIEAAFMRALADLLLRFHDIDLIDHGREDGAPDFRETLDRVSFIKRARREGDTLLQSLPTAGTHASALAENLAATLKSASAQNLVEAHAALDFNLEAGTWPGATLEQGVWYEMEMPLPLPYAPLLLINHQVEFAFTRRVACSSEASTASCVEIVLHAVPDPSALQLMLDETRRSAHLPRGRELQSAATTTLRLVTDPDTLIPYRREIRRQGYLSGDGSPNDALLTEERMVIASGPVSPAAED